MSLLSKLLPVPTRDTTPSAASAPAPDAGPVVVPRYQITETPEAYRLLVELPGVGRDDLELSVDHEHVRVGGRAGWVKPAGWTARSLESEEARRELVLAHHRAINPDKVHAELRDGLLRVTLPKAEELKPRKITVA